MYVSQTSLFFSFTLTCFLSHVVAPLEPAGFQMNSVNSTAVQFSWKAPLDSPSTGDVNSYLLDCQPIPSKLPFPIAFPAASLTASADGMFVMTLNGFVPGTLYHCSLLAINPAGNGAIITSSDLTKEEGIIVYPKCCSLDFCS